MKKKKLSWVSVGNMVGLLVSSFVIGETTYRVVIEPYFTMQMVSITKWGFIVLLMAFITFASCHGYFEDRWNNE